MKKSLLICSVFAAICNSSYAQAGALDLSFDVDGRVTTAVSPAEDYANSIAIQSDGKILVGGFAKVGANNEFALCRYNTDGSLDNTFSADGMLTTAIGTFDGSSGMALQADGKIVLAGYSMGTNLDFAVVRYNADGTLDNTFSGDGKATAPVGAGLDVGSCIALQADGKIVIAGKSNNGTNTDFSLARFNADGTLDAGFGTAGTVITAFAGGTSEARTIAIQADGKILVGGSCSTGGSPYAVARYNTDGTLDNTFSGDGMLDGQFITGGTSVINSIKVLADGKILIGGDGRSGTVGDNRDFSIARLNADGSADASFGTAGVTVTHFGTEHDNLNSLALQSDGKIVAGGYAYTGTSLLEFALIRYNTDGSLDAGFGTAGKLVTEMGTGGNQIMALAIQTDGKIIGAGSVNAGTTADFAIARYLPTAGSTTVAGIPAAFRTASVYPNPTNENATISYALSQAEDVSIYLVDLQGRILKTIAEKEAQAPGNYARQLALPQGAPAGNYFIILSTPAGQERIKIVVTGPQGD